MKTIKFDLIWLLLIGGQSYAAIMLGKHADEPLSFRHPLSLILMLAWAIGTVMLVVHGQEMHRRHARLKSWLDGMGNAHKPGSR